MRQTVNILVRHADGRVLMQMRDSKPHCNPLTWDFWGGGMEPEDADACAAAARELTEELCMQVSSMDFQALTVRQTDEEETHFVAFLKPVAWSMIQIGEGAGAAFFTLDELRKIPVTDRVLWVLEHKPEVFA